MFFQHLHTTGSIRVSPRDPLHDISSPRLLGGPGVSAADQFRQVLLFLSQPLESLHIRILSEVGDPTRDAQFLWSPIDFPRLTAMGVKIHSNTSPTIPFFA